MPGTGEFKRRAKEWLGIAQTDSVILYAPDQRDTKQSRDGSSDSPSIVAEMLSAGTTRSITLLVRDQPDNFTAPTRTTNVRVHNVSTYTDTSELALIADVLVTDHSSMVIDFMLTRKPVVFYRPNSNDDQETLEDCYVELDGPRPGPLCRSASELAPLIHSALTHPEQFIDERYQRFAAQFAPLDDDQAGKRVLRALDERGWFREPEP